MNSLSPFFRILRPQQWVKNLILFSAIFFNGELFRPSLFVLSFHGFMIFCLISSASYIFNDMIDLPFDQKHPLKRKRPLAAGELTTQQAAGMSILLFFIGLGWAYMLNFGFFMLTLLFTVLHILYSVKFKKYALLDIFTIAFSFMIRVLGSEILGGFHLSVWMFLTIFFAALFLAAAKRHAELLKRGTDTREALNQYQDRLLNFYVTTFATASIISYILFTFLQPTLKFDSTLGQILQHISVPKMVERKWLILTTPLFVFGISRYSQLVYEGKKGERPEHLITTDSWLLAAMASWGVIMFLLLYL